jgi:hypothetical protein
MVFLSDRDCAALQVDGGPVCPGCLAALGVSSLQELLVQARLAAEG